jgi:archaeal flagellin FlaB
MKRLTSALRRIHREERGITGLETAIILIAFVVVATIFAFVVLTTGIFSAERGKETVFAGLAKARGTMEVRGGVVVSATGTVLAVDHIFFTVATTAGGESIPLDPDALTNRTVIAYRDSLVTDNDVLYSTGTEDIVGDDDTLLEPGEVKVIDIDVADIDGSPALAANDRFTLEIQTPVGAVIDITRQLPAELAEVMQLH